MILISPFLKLNDRMKELLADKNRLKIDVRIVYGKSELQPQEIEWLRGLTYIRTSFCKNLHAKCYMNEEMCIITSLNLYEFSQVNNNEMGILIQRSDDGQLYKDAYEEAQRIIRISDEVRISLERVASSDPEPAATPAAEASGTDSETSSRRQDSIFQAGPEVRAQNGTTAGPGHRTGLSLAAGGQTHALTAKGEQAGVEFVAKSRFGPYFLWPQDLALN